MTSGTQKICQNCHQDFIIDERDFAFYEKIKVPPPTFCPECRMIRRFLWRNEHHLFRGKDAYTGKEIFSGYPASVPAAIYEHDFWNSDSWEPMDYGRDHDFSRPFFEQFRELLYAVPWPSRNILNLVNSDYSNNANDLKNAYLCFNCSEIENSAYVVSALCTKESFDLYETRHSELCYEGYMVDESYHVFFSVNVEESTDIWFSKNLIGCNNCFGCVNLRNKSYHIFNKPYSKEAYRKQLAQFDTGSFSEVEKLKKEARELWQKSPMRFTLAIRAVNSTGEHIEKSKNLKICYDVHDAEDLAYCQLITGPATDSYDWTAWGAGASQIYESMGTGLECYGVRFCVQCWPSSTNVEYCIHCRSSSDLFGCVGLKKKQYCIFNKQYSKEDYAALRGKIIKHMNEKPYISRVRTNTGHPERSEGSRDSSPAAQNDGIVYRYGEFFPPEFSPFAYNETLAGDFFPLTKKEAESKGFLWREPELRHYETTIDAKDLPDHIRDVDDSILKEIIKCASCGRAYRLIRMEFEFYKKIGLPLPRLCHNCRFQERFKFVNPPKLWHAACHCDGRKSQAPNSKFQYENTASHPSHKPDERCPNEFETSYAPGRPEIVYCEQCYKSEVA